MYCRIHDQEENRYYRSIVYGIIYDTKVENYIVLDPLHSQFRLIPYWRPEDGPLNPQVFTIQPDRSGWVDLKESYVLPLTTYLRTQGMNHCVLYYSGYPDVCKDHAFLAALLAQGSVPAEDCAIALHPLPDADNWRYLLTQADADAFMHLFAGFHDSTLDKLVYEESQGMSRITATFDNSGWYGVIEMCFDGVTAIHICPPLENRDRFIGGAILRVSDEGVLWADEDFDDETADQYTFIKALSTKWRKIG
ncbi:MAG: hypothetical protein E7318_07850 [Clostridiales bacterium]|nr:hypothetical protein [Clostridiales bacterium]